MERPSVFVRVLGGFKEVVFFCGDEQKDGESVMGILSWGKAVRMAGGDVMQGFQFTELRLDGACLIQNFSVGDCRGGFTKMFERDIFLANGISFTADEVFASVSAKNVIRGLHFQLHHPQAKLVTVLSGRVWDVIVDLRPDSGSFGEWVSAELSDENHHALYVPRGFAHGFAALEDGTVMLYQCEGRYDKETDTGIRFDDPELGICWPVREDMAIYSERDMGFAGLKEYREKPMEGKGL